MSDQLEKIPTPWHLQWRRIRYQFVPVLSLIACVLATGWLWNRRLGSISTYGRVQIVQADATSPMAGLLVPADKPIELYAEVEAQQVVARLDSGPLNKELALAEQEVLRLRNELKAREGGAPSTRPATELVTGMTLDELKLALTAAEAKLEDVEYRLDSMDIHAPITGRVTAIHCVPGQAVIQGQLILTITSDDSSQVISYVRQDQRFKPVPGMPVELRSQLEGALVSAEVKQVGPRVESIPTQQLRDPKTPEWGIPVTIAIPQQIKFRPGELVEVRFRNPDPIPSPLPVP